MKIQNDGLIAKKQNVRILLTFTMCSQDKHFVSRINKIHTEQEIRFRDKVSLNKPTNNQPFKQRLLNIDKSSSLNIRYILKEWLVYKRRPEIFLRGKRKSLER